MKQPISLRLFSFFVRWAVSDLHQKLCPATSCLQTDWLGASHGIRRKFYTTHWRLQHTFAVSVILANSSALKIDIPMVHYPYSVFKTLKFIYLIWPKKAFTEILCPEFCLCLFALKSSQVQKKQWKWQISTHQKPIKNVGQMTNVLAVESWKSRIRFLLSPIDLPIRQPSASFDSFPENDVHRSVIAGGDNKKKKDKQKDEE